MATSVPKATREFMETYGVQSDEVWLVPGGKAYAIKHSALERIAAEKGIQFGVPSIIEGSSDAKTVVLLGTAKMGERQEWSFGEASPGNNKNAYVWSMAEKRLKDRLTLKLLNTHGAIYSEEEADDFKQSRREQDADVIPIGDGPRKTAHAIKTTRPKSWPLVVDTLRACTTYSELMQMGASDFVKEETKDWPVEWLNQLRFEEFQPLAKSLKAAEESVVWAG